MDPILFLAFLTTTLLFVAVPGPSVAFATAQAVRHGPRAAFVAVAGDALGTIVHIAIAASSLSLLLSLSEMILPVLQIAGGLFLIWMAVRSFQERGKSATAAPQPSGKVTFWAGFFACVANPKAIVFFVALFPAFISPDHTIWLQSLIYGAVFIVLDALSILGFALLTMLSLRRATRRWLSPEVLAGLGLFGVGLGMIVKGYRALPQS